VVQSLLLADPAGEAELVDVPGDGNCLLSALALVFDDSRSVADIRRATCTYVKAHWKELNWPHITSQSAADSWYERYRRDRVWVGHDFAFAYCTANAVNLSVSLLHTPRKGKNKGVPSLKEELIIAKPELREVRRIVYVNDNHYCAIIHMGPLVADADADIDNAEDEAEAEPDADMDYDPDAYDDGVTTASSSSSSSRRSTTLSGKSLLPPANAALLPLRVLTRLSNSYCRFSH
jgi:hypothetical protein